MATPNLKEIEWAISELEQDESTENRYVLLAALYTCRNQMLGVNGARPQISAYSGASGQNQPEKIFGMSGSEFLRAVSEKETEKAWQIMDELMETLRVVNKRVYDGVMRKLERI